MNKPTYDRIEKEMVYDWEPIKKQNVPKEVADYFSRNEVQAKLDKAKEVKKETLEVLGGEKDPNAQFEFSDVVKLAKEGILFDALQGVEAIFTPEEIA